eukprot:TRINITY_DN22080_c0_g1_i5.p1 TRINITY_DN22080_c0_g1~~TRINITY_DN22080_c0_g1_i5.p1  ORF type:complete len:605 (+),score=162.47 TRINITY_DN22080_c0_g1_i5:66-1880(+)
MTDIIALGTVGLAHIGGFSTVAPRYFSDHGDEHEDALDDIIENISDAGKDSYRSDMISDVNAGLGVMATGIRLISAILTVLGATGNRRGDEYEEAVQSLMSLGAAMLRVGGSNLLDYFASPSPTSPTGPISVNKLGVAADTEDTGLSQDEILHRIQVQKIVSSLTPEQIQAQQGVVFSHIQQQQIQDSLTDEEATKLLVETLEHNGLPVPDSLRPGSDTKNTGEIESEDSVNTSLATKVSSVLSGATGIISSLLTPSSSQQLDPTSQATNLPQAGTWEHTVMLSMFNAQQSVNMMLMDIFGDDTIDTNHIGGQFIKSDKVGQAAFTPNDDPSPDNGILASVAALPQSVSNAAYQLVKFVLPPSGTEPESETYSEVAAGVKPAHAALGLLATGAIGSVIYSYVATDSDLASSVTDLASGAVDLVRRKGLVSAAADALASVTTENTEDDKEKYISNADYNYYDDSIYPDSGYSDYGYGYPTLGYHNQATSHQSQEEYQSDNPDTYYHPQDEYQSDNQGAYYQSQEEYEGEHLPEDFPHKIPESVEFYEPEHNPWLLLGSGQSTDHLYRNLNKRGASSECENNFARCQTKLKRKLCLIRRKLCRKRG